MTKILTTAGLIGELSMLTLLVWVSVNKKAREEYRQEAYHVGAKLGLS